MFLIHSAKFPTFAAAAACALVHARQRGECQVRNAAGALLADFVARKDGTISICATDYGRELVEGWA
jgi:hypothetical protein